MKSWATPEDNIPVLLTELGTIGLLTCSDIRFPEAVCLGKTVLLFVIKNRSHRNLQFLYDALYWDPLIHTNFPALPYPCGTTAMVTYCGKSD